MVEPTLPDLRHAEGDGATATRHGRFRITGTLGAGGMGVVLAAHDPELDRQVAIKVLHPDAGRRGGSLQSSARLAREARAMARLAHPNVVTVYEVGELGGRTLIAMELVAGTSLRHWIGSPHSWREVVAMMVGAGRGLAAAHGAGLVHRDFKPDNVLIGADGRPRVTDFGLVTAAPIDPPAAPVGAELAAGLPPGPPVPVTVSLAGTPAYMAPEQWRGEQVGPAADQFAFCVVFWEALFGQRPFHRDDPATMRDAACAGRLGAPTPRGDVPRWLEGALRRGLAPTPATRWPGLDPLLALIERRAHPAAGARRRWFAAAAGVVVVASIGGWLVRGRAAAGPGVDTCAALPDRFAEVWNPTRARSTRAALVATGVGFADRAFAEIARTLDNAHATWLATQGASCQATRRGEQSDAMLDLRARCLARALDDVRSYVDQLQHTDADGARLAAQQAAEVADLGACADVDALARRAPLPTDPTARAVLEDLEVALAGVRAKIAAGRHRDVVDASATLVARAAALGYQPALAEALILRAQVQDKRDQAVEAEASLGAASLAAEAGGDDGLRFDCEVRLTTLVGQKLERPVDALRHDERAQALISRLGPDPLRLARRAWARATLDWSRGEYAAALAVVEEAVAGYAAVDPDGIDVARALHMRAIIENDLHQDPQAIASEDRAVAIAARALGDQHPMVANFLMTRANALRRLGRLDEARAAYLRSLDILRAFYGPDASIVGGALGNLATVDLDQGRYGDAIPRLRQAYAIYVATLGPEHSFATLSAGLLGTALSRAGDAAEAEALLRHVVEVDTRRAGPGSMASGAALEKLADHYLRRGQLAAARATYVRAGHAVERVSPDPARAQRLARVFLGEADAARAAGASASARRAYQRARAVLATIPDGDEQLKQRATDGLAAIGR
ncbi:MAG: serine/threonine-protein kinase [Kofleriaceae bacterium]